MPWPDFSEFSFGYAFLREFEAFHCSGGTFPLAPDFISQAKEASVGYDVEVLNGSTPTFFQFKRSFVLTTSNAGEIKNGDFNHLPLYRMHLRPKNNYAQHAALRALEALGNAVFYVTSQVPSQYDLSGAYCRGQILDEAAALFLPSEITIPNPHPDHHVTFRADADYGYIYSAEGFRFERKAPTFDLGLERALRPRIQSADYNRQILLRTLEQFSEAPRQVLDVASRFSEPITKLAILAYLVLDVHLVFFKPAKLQVAKGA